MGDAVALLELTGVAAGYYVLDRMLKHSPVDIIEANLVEPGKFLVLYTGGVAEVEEAHNIVLQERANEIIEELVLPFAHPSLVSGLQGEELRQTADEYDCLGVVETVTVTGSLLGADRAIKDAGVSLVGIRVAGGLGGRAYFIVCGAQHDVEVALEVAEEQVNGKGGLRRRELIPRPHSDMIEWLLRPAPFSVRR